MVRRSKGSFATRTASSERAREWGAEQMNDSVFPQIDPRIRAVGLSYLRQLKAEALSGTDYFYLIQDRNTPLAVVMPYDVYMKILAVMRTSEEIQ
jgi:hypothetical protein